MLSIESWNLLKGRVFTVNKLSCTVMTMMMMMMYKQIKRMITNGGRDISCCLLLVRHARNLPADRCSGGWLRARVLDRILVLERMDTTSQRWVRIVSKRCSFPRRRGFCIDKTAAVQQDLFVNKCLWIKEWWSTAANYHSKYHGCGDFLRLFVALVHMDNGPPGLKSKKDKRKTPPNTIQITIEKWCFTCQAFSILFLQLYYIPIHTKSFDCGG